MYRIIDVNSGEVLSLDHILTIDHARRLRDEIESHETQPQAEIQCWVGLKPDGSNEWSKDETTFVDSLTLYSVTGRVVPHWHAALCLLPAGDPKDFLDLIRPVEV